MNCHVRGIWYLKNRNKSDPNAISLRCGLYKEPMIQKVRNP